MDRRLFTQMLNGVFVPLVTPLNENGEIDVDVENSPLEALINHVISGRVNGVISNGTMGEFYGLNHKKRKENLMWTVQFVGGRVPVIANITDNIRHGGMKEVLERTYNNIDDAAEGSATAVMLDAYYYDGIADKNVVDFTQEAANYAQQKELPLLLYHIPVLHAGERILFSGLVRKLSKHQNIVGIKDSSDNFKYFMRLLSLQDDYFKVLQGSEELFYESFRHTLKPSGIVSSFGNVATRFVVDFYKKLERFNDEIVMAKDESVRLFYEQSIENYNREMNQVSQLVYRDGYQAVAHGIKCWLKEKGIIRTHKMATVDLAPLSHRNIQRAEKLISSRQLQPSLQ